MQTRIRTALWTLVVVLLLSPLAAVQAESQHAYPLVEKVNPLVGTAAHGHTFPGVVLPFGMVQLSPDTGNVDWDWCSGYHYTDRSIMGFSHTHLSGTGCADLGDFLLMPTIGPLKFQPGSKANPDEGYRSRFSHDREKAMPGSYEVSLDDYEIEVRLTATRRVGFHQYTYPATREANVIIDITHFIGGTNIRESRLEIIGDREVRGYVRKSGWSPDRFLYFVAQFSRPFVKSGLVVDGELQEAKQRAEGKNLKGYVRFDASEDRQLQIKVAISAVSCDGAAKNMQAECPGWDFEQVRNDAMQTWEEQLSKITVEGGPEAAQRTFYTALYHSCLAPYLFSDVDGRYRGMDQKIHQAEGFENYTVFSLWDTFRATHPLFTLIEERRTNDFINAMLHKYEQKGLLPYWELASGETWCMIGYHAIPVIADAWVKGIRGYDVDKAFEAMKKSAMQDHQGLVYYKQIGYVPMEGESNSASRTMEYAYDDWCIAMMAKGLGREDDEATFTRRSQNYRNLFDTSTGFVRGKDAGGAWNEDFDPDLISALGSGEFTEGNAWHYTWFAPHDVQGLIDLMGGVQPFVDKLDQLFTRPGYEHADVTGLIGQYAHGNEPCHNYAYLYTYAGEHGKTQQHVSQIVRTLYSDQPDGLCGNEDCGQMSAWYVFSAMGFYPVCPGQPIYVFGTPRFPSVTLHLENGNQFQVVADGVSEENIYIQSATLNGQPYDKAYLRHEDILAGGRLIFQMGPAPNKQWAQDQEDLPYSSPGKAVMATPYLANPQQAFLDQTTVDLRCDDPAAEIFYTLDGTVPDRSSTPFEETVAVNATTTVKARAYRKGALPSTVMTVRLVKLLLGPAQEVGPVEQGLHYSLYEGNFEKTADMKNRKPVVKGRCRSFDATVAERDDEFGLEFTGYFRAPEAGIYQFWTRSDDGSRLYVDSKLVVDNDGLHGAKSANGFAALADGLHEIKVLYFEGQVDNMLEVSVVPPGGRKQPFSPNWLYRKAISGK